MHWQFRKNGNAGSDKVLRVRDGSAEQAVKPNFKSGVCELSPLRDLCELSTLPAGRKSGVSLGKIFKIALATELIQHSRQIDIPVRRLRMIDRHSKDAQRSTDLRLDTFKVCLQV